MRYSIFILLFFIYALLGLIAFYVIRMMRRETRLLEAGGPISPPEGSEAQTRQ
jgi:hypothetical protein